MKEKIKKIKDLNLLPKYHTGGSFSGMDYIGIVSWNDWVLEGIRGDKLFLKIKKGISGTGQKSEVNFRKNAYNKLTDKEKKNIEKAFKENIGSTIGSILELNFT